MSERYINVTSLSIQLPVHVVQRNITYTIPNNFQEYTMRG